MAAFVGELYIGSVVKVREALLLWFPAGVVNRQQVFHTLPQSINRNTAGVELRMLVALRQVRLVRYGWYELTEAGRQAQRELRQMPLTIP